MPLNPQFLTAVRLKHAPPASSYVSSLPVVQWLLREQVLHLAPVTILVGENGVGKSTLLEAIAVAAGFNPEGGSINFQFSTADTHSPLYRCLGLIRGTRRPRDGFFLRAESFYNVATNVDELAELPGGEVFMERYGGQSLHAQSHGESFLSLVLNRFVPDGLYLLDEPEAALSPTRQMTLLCRLYALSRQGCQILLSTHSPILLALPGATVYELRSDGIHQVDWKDTEHYQITRRFLDAPEQMLRLLLESEDSGKGF